MKDLNHEPDFDPALEHELRKHAPLVKGACSSAWKKP